MKKHTVKFISEFLPIILFFISYKFYGIITATATIIAASVFGLLITYIFHKRIPSAQLFTVLIIVIFGGITVFSKDPTFIKIKPTILNLCFAGGLLFGLINKKLYIKSLLGDKINIADQHWKTLSKRFIFLFAFIAILNELVWRNFSEETWIYFKTFGILPVLILFIILQVPFIMKNQS
ncbi:MAG: septation protein IspZ [Alphaproteobacteria bacterium]|nr:septation protein IspZ [Alphaproteobacteria bacterium]